MPRLTVVPIAAILAGAAAILASCAPDPYNVLPQCRQVEAIVMGEAALESQQPRPYTGEYLLYEGKPFQDGGIEYKPFTLTDIAITPPLGSAILARKSRFTEIFGLLSKGAAGEAASGRIVPRVGLGELTAYERNLLDAENKDRSVIMQAFLEGKKVPLTDEVAIQRVFSFARYQFLTDGVWVEERPGEWRIKGGREVRLRTMAREPAALEPPVEETATTTTPAQPAPRRRLRVESTEPQVR